MQHVDDQDLLEGFFSGDEESFETIVSKYESRVFHTALYLTETTEDAEIVLQDVFVELHHKLVGDKGKTPLFDWLLQRTLDLSVEQLINKKRENVCLPEHSANLQSMNSHVAQFEQKNACMRNSIQQATRQLPSTLKFVFLLRDIQGLSITRVAAILGINVFEARTRLHQARLRLHEQLIEQHGHQMQHVS